MGSMRAWLTCQPSSGSGSSAERPSVTPIHASTHLEVPLKHPPMSLGPSLTRTLLSKSTMRIVGFQRSSCLRLASCLPPQCNPLVRLKYCRLQWNWCPFLQSCTHSSPPWSRTSRGGNRNMRVEGASRGMLVCLLLERPGPSHRAVATWYTW